MSDFTEDLRAGDMDQVRRIFLFVRSLQEIEELKKLFMILNSPDYNFENLKKTYAIALDQIQSEKIENITNLNQLIEMGLSHIMYGS